MNVARLVKKAKKGNKEALLQLILAEKDAYFRLALTYMENKHDAMDAMEDMIVTLYEKIGQLKNEDSFYSWSKTILVNCCKAMHRKKNRVVLMDDWQSAVENKDNNTKNNPLPNHEERLDMDAALLQLNDKQKESIQLKYFHDMDYESIAALTNVSVGTVKSRVFQGLKKLREHVGGDNLE
jgi:RNA polymerase sigma factor (sigma-70 family)